MNGAFEMFRRLSAFAACVLYGLSATACSYATVGSGEIGVVWTPDGKPHALPEGEWGVGTYDRTTIYNTRSQEHEERLEVLAANGLKIVLDTSIRYHIVADEAVALDHDLGIHYYDVLIGPTLKSQARRVIGRYQPEEIYSTQREVIERQIREGVEGAIKGRHVVLEGVLIRNVTLPESIQAAINDKLQAEQAALKMKFVIAQSEAEQQKQLVEEKAQAERQKIAAQAAADAKRIDAQATDDYARIIQQHMSEKMLAWQRIEAMRALAASSNAKVIMTGDGKGAVLDIK